MPNPSWKANAACSKFRRTTWSSVFPGYLGRTSRALSIKSFNARAKTKPSRRWRTSFPRLATRLTWRIGCAWPGRTMLRGFCIWRTAAQCSWQEWAQYAIDVCHNLGVPLKADRVGKLSLTDMKNFVARRPVYTVLSTAKFTALTGVQPRHWREAIAEYISAHVSKK